MRLEGNWAKERTLEISIRDFPIEQSSFFFLAGFPSLWKEKENLEDQDRSRQNRSRTKVRASNFALNWFCIHVFVLLIAGVPTYDSDYLGDEQSEDYNYEDDYTEEEPQPLLNPQFTTEAQNFKMEVGQVLRLPCFVDKLGKDSK